MPSQPPNLFSRSSGLLLHISSLPGKFGIGDLGPAAYAWVDGLARARQRWWQILPLGPPGEGDSPYQAFSAFAGNPMFISPELLAREGLLTAADLRQARAPDGEHGSVDYPFVNRHKPLLLERAYQPFSSGASPGLRRSFARFCHDEAQWLEDYCLFMALRRARQGREWQTWPEELLRRKPNALAEAQRDLAGAIDHCRFEQFLFFHQWKALRDYAAGKGVGIIGDLPIYVSLDSADVWASQHLFQLDARRRPRAVAGVPPDAFSASGQRWGNPLYDWRAMQREKFAWWTARLRALLKLVDAARIDHFRGLAAYWSIPASQPTARKGRWIKAPGDELLSTLRRELGSLPLIAEDLGVITPDVEALRNAHGLPGMRVLQFGFGGDAGNPHLPHNHLPASVIYTGTHDNDTSTGWFGSLGARERAHVRSYAPGDWRDPAAGLMRLAWASTGDLAIAPVQDVLGLGSEARMNTPGTESGNWRWRMTGPLTRKQIDRLAALTGLYGRAGS